MAERDLVAEIRRFLIDSFVPDKRPEDLPLDLNLFKSGILDSLAVITTAGFLEELGGREIESRELTTDNFGSIAAIAALMERLDTAERESSGP